MCGGYGGAVDEVGGGRLEGPWVWDMDGVDRVLWRRMMGDEACRGKEQGG